MQRKAGERQCDDPNLERIGDLLSRATDKKRLIKVAQYVMHQCCVSLIAAHAVLQRLGSLEYYMTMSGITTFNTTKQNTRSGSVY